MAAVNVPEFIVTVAPAIAVPPEAFVAVPEIVPGVGSAALIVVLPPALMPLAALRTVPKPLLEKRTS